MKSSPKDNVQCGHNGVVHKGDMVQRIHKVMCNERFEISPLTAAIKSEKLQFADMSVVFVFREGERSGLCFDVFSFALLACICMYVYIYIYIHAHVRCGRDDMLYPRMCLQEG